MQAKDITVGAYVAAARAVKARRDGYASTFLVAEELGAPHKVVMAKTRKLQRQGVVDSVSCPCGCSSPLFLSEEFQRANLIQQIAELLAKDTDIPRGFFDA